MRPRGCGGLLVLLGLLAPAAAQDLPPGVLTLARAKQHMREAVSRLPDYTCLETMQRFRKPAGRRTQFRQYDTMRLETLYAGGAEFFASPGSRNFAETDVSAFSSNGLTGNGFFALTLKQALLDGTSILVYAGEETRAGRKTAKYEFTISPFLRPLTLTNAHGTGTAGLRGSIWIDVETLDVLRVESNATEIPAELFVAESKTTVDYARTPIGAEDVLLPRAGELYMADTDGKAERSAVEFTNCRSYQAESVLRFDEEPAPPAGSVRKAAPQPAAPVVKPRRALPAGLSIAVALETPITEKDSVGALLEGRIVHDVAYNGGTLAPAGALVHGRLRGLDRHSDSNGSYFGIAIEFTEIETARERLRFFADLTSTDEIQGFSLWIWTRANEELPPNRRGEVSRLSHPDLPGVGSFFVRANRLNLPKGLQTIWRTRPVE